MRNHTLEGLHDFRAFTFLVILKTSSDDNNNHQDQTQVKLKIKTRFKKYYLMH